MANPEDILAGLLHDSVNGKQEPDTVIDADTFRDEDGEKIRIQGVDAPETGRIDVGRNRAQPQQAGADLAADYLAELLKSGVDIERTGRTTYDRHEAEVTTEDGVDVGTSLTRAGLARPTMFSDQEQINAATQSNVLRSGIFDEGFDEETLERHYELEVEKALNPFEPDYSSVTASEARDHNAFTSSVERGVDRSQGLLYAASNAFGGFIGVDAIEEFGLEGFERNMVEAAHNPAEVEKFDDIETLGQLGTYVVEAIGEQVPNIALTATGAGAAAVGVRAAIGKAALMHMTKQYGGRAFMGNFTKEGLKNLASREAAMRMSKSALARNAHLLGAAATSYPLGVGEVQQELLEGGINSPGTALFAGIPFTALEVIGFDRTIGQLFRGVKKQLAEDMIGSVAKGFGLGAVQGAAAEIPTEMMQEIISLSARAFHDPEFEIFSDENIDRIREAGIKAGIAGGFFGGVGGGTRQAIDFQAPQTPPPVEDLTEGQDIPPGPIPPETPVQGEFFNAPLESIPESAVIEVEGIEEPVPARIWVKSEFDDRIKKFEDLARCIGG